MDQYKAILIVTEDKHQNLILSYNIKPLIDMKLKK